MAMTTRKLRQAGFSLVELMVASAVGLIVALGVLTVITSSGRQYAVLSANVSAQSNAQIGLSLMDLSGRNAGAGFYSAGQAICPTWNAFNGSAMVANGAAWMPARIVDGGGNGVSDTLVFTGGAGNRPLGAAPVLADAVSAASINVSNSSAFANGDYAVIGAPGSGLPCTLFQVTQAPAVVASCGGNAHQCQLLVRSPNEGLNPATAGPGSFANTPTFGFETAGTATGPAVVSRVGSVGEGFRQEAFAVQCQTLVRFNAFTTAALPACTPSPLAFGAGVDALATDTVLMHAQYGVSNAASSDVVAQWVNASGATWGGTPAVDDIARIKAVRIVVVSRSRESEAGDITAPCTNAAGVANTGPCSFEDAAAPVIDLSTVALPAGRTWRNYRYRVHAAVIPLRTVIWSDS
jgi:type IV pilus assembly protein PilW